MMDAIRLTAVITEDHELTVKVPDNIPPGEVELLIQVPSQGSSTPTNLARATARAKLAAAGILSTAVRLPSSAILPTEAELDAAGKLPSNSRLSEDLINEDRDEQW